MHTTTITKHDRLLDQGAYSPAVYTADGFLCRLICFHLLHQKLKNKSQMLVQSTDVSCTHSCHIRLQLFKLPVILGTHTCTRYVYTRGAKPNRSIRTDQYTTHPTKCSAPNTSIHLTLKSLSRLCL